MTLSSLPIFVVDIVGSVLMIVLSFQCLRLALRLRKADANNVIWAYLMWVCYALTLFAVSRSAGHILKQILMMTGRSDWWAPIRPVSGALNSFSFMIVASVTLFFERTWKIYREINNDKRALVQARDELLYLNQNLEDLVAERTDELTQSEQKYRNIFESSKDIILVTDGNGTIVDINPAGYRTFGWQPHQPPLVGSRLPSFFKDADQWRRMMDIMSNDTGVSNLEVDLKRADGTIFKALVTGGVDPGGAGGDVIHLLIKDIQERRMMEKHMAQTDKLASIGEFSAGIAHEINNPLGIILGYTQLLQRGESADTERYNDLKTIEKHVRSCKSIVEDLLNFARTSAPVRNSADIHQLIDEVIAFIQQHTRNDSVRILTRYDTRLPRLVIDEKKINQVFMNLIMNAKHAVGNQGTIQITTALDAAAQKAVIRVTDDGHGIEAKHLGRIFDPFFTTKPTGEGTGLGLSVSYGIIKNHDGDIMVDSMPSEGTTFTVTLPADHDAPSETS